MDDRLGMKIFIICFGDVYKYFLFSLLYDLICQSEIFDDTPDVTPSIMVELLCPANYDCKIRINVYYSSNLTHNKEIVLAGTTFGLRELLRSYKLFTSVMNSEYCAGAKAIVEVAQIFPSVLTSTALYPMAPPVRGNYRNPLIQHFAFFHEDDITSPLVDCQEMAWEPKYSFKLPMMFMDNISDKLYKSLAAWKHRLELERMRQGRFKNEEEAFSKGWHVLKLQIVGTQFTTSENKRFSASFSAPNDKEIRSGTGTICLCSYVDACIDNKKKQFATGVGRTNTEYYNNEPQYGSNLHVINKRTQEFVTAGPAVQLVSKPKTYQFKCIDPSKDNGMEVVTVQGTVNHFVTYIPDCKNSCLRLNLYVEFQDKDGVTGNIRESNANTTQGPVLCGYAFVGLLEGEDQDVSVPVMMVEAYNTYFEAQIRVKVSVRSSGVDTDFHDDDGSSAPFHFPSVALVNPEEKFKAPVGIKGRNAPVFASNRASMHLDSLDVGTNFETDKILSACYDWMWLIGYSGNDPLAGPNTLQKRRASSVVGSVFNSVSPDGTVVVGRVDVEYPLEWLEEHVRNIEALYKEMKQLIFSVNAKIANSESFRASVKKKDKDYQFLPINLHMQMLLSRRHTRADEEAYQALIAAVSSNQAPSALQQDIHVTDSVTCGSPSPHGLGHKGGGLDVLENDLFKQKQALELLKDQFFNVAGDASCLPPNGGAASLLQRISNSVLTYEQSVLTVAKRRMFAVSQALTTAVSGVLMKLALLAEGYIVSDIAQEWVSFGMVVLFEGLLSVTGNERSMVEDTMVAVESLRLFSIKLVQCDDLPPNSSTFIPTHRESQGTYPAAPSRTSAAGAPQPSLSSTTSPTGVTYSPIGYSSYMGTAFDDSMHVSIAGREVTIHIPTSTFIKLPSCLRQSSNNTSSTAVPGVTIRLLSVFINQVCIY